MDWRAIELSLRLSTLTTFLLLILGLPLASWLAFSAGDGSFCRSRRSLADYTASDGLGFLRADCHRSAQPDRASLCGAYRTRPPLFIPRASFGFGALQSAIRRAALHSRNFGGRPTVD